MNRIEIPGINPCVYSQETLTRVSRIHHREMMVSSVYGAGNWIPICKRMKLDTYLSQLTKIDSEWIKDLNTRLEIIKLLGANTGWELFDTDLGNNFFFLNMAPKADRKSKHLKSGNSSY